MPEGNPGGEHDLPAGDFSSWMTTMGAAIAGDAGSNVPCDGCTACCTSYQFVHIAPDETDTLAHIPTELLFPAPRLPRGHMLLGYDERGHCPMLVDGACSIYEHRPRTCRTYDCRVFPAAGMEVDDDKVAIARRAGRWQFSFPTAAARTQHDAVRAAARYLDGHADHLPGSAAPASPTQLAVLAIQIHDVFLGRDEATAEATLVDPEPEAVRVEIARRARATSVPRADDRHAGKVPPPGAGTTSAAAPTSPSQPGSSAPALPAQRPA